MKATKSTAKRYTYMDGVRILGCLLVISLHMATLDVKLFSVTGIEWKVMNLMESVGMNGVALFFMLSGALFLRPDAELSLKYIWKKIGILFVVYIVCLFGYNLMPFLKGWEPWEWQYLKIDLFGNVLRGIGIYHMGFLPTLMVLYALTPLLKPAFAEKKNCEYFLALFLVFGAVIPFVLRFEFANKDILQGIEDSFGLFLLTGHVGYYVLGHYLHEFGKRLDKKRALLAGVLIVIVVSITMFCNHQDAVAKNQFSTIANTPLSITGILFTGSIYMLVKTGLEGYTAEKGEKWLRYLASLTFGIYLIHPLIMNEVVKVLPWSEYIPPYIPRVVIRYLFVVISAGLVTAVVKKIPFVKKLL